MPIPAFLAAGLAGAIPAAVNTIGSMFGQNRQQRMNRRNADYQYSKDLELMKYQMDYNSPGSQMQRFKEAGLNPNLIYGQGSAGNMESAPRYPEIGRVDYQSALAQIGTQYQQARLMASQADLTQQKVSESGVKQDLMAAQKNLVNANPYLNEAYVKAMVTNLQSVATMKKQQSDFMTTMDSYQTGTGEITISPRGVRKMQIELDSLVQRFNLGTSDQKIKAEVIQSKEFQNELQRIQVQWMKDGEITPQHIYQGIMLLLQKLM